MGCEFRVFFDGTRANFGTIDHEAPPQARMPLPQLGYHPLQEVRKSNGRPLRTPPFALSRITLWELHPVSNKKHALMQHDEIVKIALTCDAIAAKRAGVRRHNRTSDTETCLPVSYTHLTLPTILLV